MGLDVTKSIDGIGFGKFQWLLLAYTGLAWVADACETMLLSFLGPAIEYGVPVVPLPVLLAQLYASHLKSTLSSQPGELPSLPCTQMRLGSQSSRSVGAHKLGLWWHDGRGLLPGCSL